MPVAVTSPATVWPVTLAEAKDRCKVDGIAHDATLRGFIAAATDDVEARCFRSFTARTLTLYSDAFAKEMLLPLGPVKTVSSVKYYDFDGSLQTLAPSVYEDDLQSDPALVALAAGQSWPVTQTRRGAVQVEYQTKGDCPPAIKEAILMWIEARFDNEPLPADFVNLLTNFRSYGA